ncbi:MAG TPA: sigma factor [Pyrinomonadaceae bacterium]|nr:sigma factor [Pyrinomonadaceae bacterium]
MPLSRKTAPFLVGDQRSNAMREVTLIPWIGRGDEAAFRRFYEATNGLLFGLLLRILGHTQTAEDVLTELYQEVRRTAARFDKQNERPLSWLIFMAHRHAIERLCWGLTTQKDFGQIPWQNQINAYSRFIHRYHRTAATYSCSNGFNPALTAADD